MSNRVTIKQKNGQIEVSDNYDTAMIPLSENVKRIEDEMELLEYVVQYAQDNEEQNEGLVYILTAVCDGRNKIFIEAVSHEFSEMLPIFKKTGFWE